MYRVPLFVTLALAGCSRSVLPGSDTEADDTTPTSDSDTSSDGGEAGSDGETTEDAGEGTDGEDSTTGTAGVCGDSIVGAEEECDDGNPSNTDECLNDCTLASCGDGYVRAGEEDCDDGNLDESDGCTSLCVLPNTCAHLLSLFPELEDGDYIIDPDGVDPDAPFPVYCDMTTASGGWTVVERSISLPQLDRALYVDFPINEDLPSAVPHRLSRTSMESLLKHADFMRIDCRGDDYLLAAASNLFNGDGGVSSCYNWTKVHYFEAQLKGHQLVDTTMCTWNISALEGCTGAWHIDEGAQSGYNCGLPDFPWSGMAITSPSADTFTVNSTSRDQQEPIHDCHVDGAQRWVMLR